jgi:hypothetical protein
MEGIVYCIECLTTGDKYYGSTIQPLEARVKAHCAELHTFENGNKIGQCVSHIILKRENYKFFVFKEVQFDDETELLWEERWAMEGDNRAINIKKPILTDEERAELNLKCKRDYAKRHYHEKKEECLAKNKAYRQTEKGKESKAKSDKKYREGPKREELLAKKREDSKARCENAEQMTCECGAKFLPCGRNRHLKTKKHKDYLDTM